jgi:hypothetical protein
MATKAEIKKAILAIAGNPESGVIFNSVDAWATAIVGLDAVVPEKPAVTEVVDGERNGASYDGPAKETRLTKPVEKR